MDFLELIETDRWAAELPDEPIDDEYIDEFEGLDRMLNEFDLS